MQDIWHLASEFREAAVHLLCLLLVLAIALVSLGPLVDHHFAERHPGHQHYYMGSADLSHSHDYENSHLHQSWVYRSSESSKGAGGAGGVVFLTPNDGAGHGAADIAVPVTMQSVRFGSADGSRPPTVHADAENSLGAASVSPSVPPPRA